MAVQVANNATTDAQEKEQNKKKDSKKVQKIIASTMFLICAATMYMLIEKQADITKQEMKQFLKIGEWVEYNVADYAKDIIIFSNDGVVYNQKLVTTNYTASRDGRSVEFRLGYDNIKCDLADQETLKCKHPDQPYSPVFKREIKL
jgi:hypothetical protein